MSMGMVNYMAGATDYFNTQVEGKMNITEISQQQGVKVGAENVTGQTYLEHQITPAEGDGIQLIDTLGYIYKAGSFVTSTLWNSTFGFHLYLRDFFNIPVMPWCLPLMILINMVNFLGLIELMTKVKIL